MTISCFFFQAEDGIRDAQESRGLGDVYKRQPLGGTPEDHNKSREMMGQLDREETIRNFVAAVQYLSLIHI